MGTAYYYQPENNPHNGSLPGVPLRDLTDEEVAQYPDYIKRSLEISPMYRKTNPNPTPRKPEVKPAKKKASAKPAPAAVPVTADPPAIAAVPAVSVDADQAPEQEN